MDCSVQSISKEDVVQVLINGKRDAKVKRLVRDSYAQFRGAHPDKNRHHEILRTATKVGSYCSAPR